MHTHTHDRMHKHKCIHTNTDLQKGTLQAEHQVIQPLWATLLHAFKDELKHKRVNTMSKCDTCMVKPLKDELKHKRQKNVSLRHLHNEVPQRCTDAQVSIKQTLVCPLHSKSLQRWTEAKVSVTCHFTTFALWSPPKAILMPEHPSFTLSPQPNSFFSQLMTLLLLSFSTDHPSFKAT